MINTARKSPKSSKVAEPTGALAEIANRSCQADPFATSRTDLQGLPEQDIVARGFDPEKLVVHRTSGSSGEPLSIRRTWFEDRLLQAYRLRVLFRLRYVSDRSAGRRGHRPVDTEPYVHAVGGSPL